MIPFYRPYYNHHEMLAALNPSRGRADFETAVANQVGANHGLAFAYGRLAVKMAFNALEIADAEVILPAYTCLVMARTVLASGNRPVFVDIDPATFNLDLSRLKQAITPKTRAIIATHMYGYPTDVQAIRTIVGDERILIIEDAALAPLKFSPYSDFTFYSFNFTKPLTTVEGGMLVTNSANLYEKVKTYHHKQQQAAPVKFLLKCWLAFGAGFGVFNPQVYGLRYWYRYQRPGAPTAYQQVMQRANRLDRAAAMPAESNFDYTHFQARLGLAQLSKLDPIIYKRRHLAQLYQRQLAELPGVSLPPLHPEAIYAYYTIRVPNCEQTGLRERMARRGVAVDRTYEYALPYLKPYQAYARRDYPQAAQLANEVLNLPCYPGLTDQQAGYVAACLRDCLREINFT